MSSMVSFFMGFHVGSLVGKIRSNKVIKSNCDHAIDLEFKVFYTFFDYQICKP